MSNLIHHGKFLIKRHVLRYGPRKIARLLAEKPPGERRVIFGSHWSNHPGWTVLNEEDQDITKRLGFPDDCLDAVFTEHVIEHIRFAAAIGFMREVHRILRPGGIMRTVCPIYDRILEVNFDEKNPFLDTYVRNSLVEGKYEKEDQLLRSLGLNGIEENRRLFFVNNLFTEHGHRFIWSAALMKKVMEALGFVDVRVTVPGEGRDSRICIERRRRGVYVGYDWQEDAASGEMFDPESRVIEGMKKPLR